MFDEWISFLFSGRRDREKGLGVVLGEGLYCPDCMNVTIDPKALKEKIEMEFLISMQMKKQRLYLNFKGLYSFQNI